MVTLFSAALLAAVSLLADQFHLTGTQQTAVISAVAQSGTAKRFTSASEAAYAAALSYERVNVTSSEVGAKIYIDIEQGAAVYSYGSLIMGQIDPEGGDPEVTYDPAAADGHFAVVGLWHRHPAGDGTFSLRGHDELIDATRQTIWTSLDRDLYVQYWNHLAGPSPALVCRGCVP